MNSISLNNVKLILSDEPEKNSLIDVYFNKAYLFVKSYCNQEELNDILLSTVEDITILTYRNFGVENLSSEKAGSLTEYFIKGLPQEIYAVMNDNRRLRRLKK